MKFGLKLLLWASLGWSCCSKAADSTPPETAGIRQKLVQAILSEGQEQQRLLTEVADSGTRVASDILNAWSHDGVFLYSAPDNSKVPVLLEETEDSSAKRRVVRIDDGKYLKDAQGAELRFGATELNTADTDMRLRSAIQQTLDTLALSAPEPDARCSAALKLGNSQKQRYVPMLQERLAKETNARVRKSFEEAIALLQLGGTDLKTRIAAVEQLNRLKAMGSLENLKAVVAKPECPPEIVAAGKFLRNHFPRDKPRLDFVGRGAGIGNHFWLDGDNQHGPRRDDCRGRVCLLCGAKSICERVRIFDHAALHLSGQTYQLRFASPWAQCHRLVL
jgi:hypothetical protein